MLLAHTADLSTGSKLESCLVLVDRRRRFTGSLMVPKRRWLGLKQFVLSIMNSLLQAVCRLNLPKRLGRGIWTRRLIALRFHGMRHRTRY